MLDGILLLWFILTAGSLIFVVYDQLTNTPSLRIMTIAWTLMILYSGPIGLFIYLLSCRQPLPGTHDQFINVHWKQTVGSLIHCVAGDATAIIFTAAILYYFELPNGIELIIEYSAAYLFGLFIFQALFMRSMYPTYSKAVSKTIFAETVSMNMVMAGMFPVIVYLKAHFPEGDNPLNPLFWAIMSIATMVGFLFAYPINSWLVRKKVKHGMMSTHPKEHMMMNHMEHEEPKVSLSKQFFISIATFAFLIFTVWVTSFFAPVSFTHSPEQSNYTHLPSDRASADK